MDRSDPISRHSRSSKSASSLPPCTELDPRRRRSGIRHFSHASLRYDLNPRKPQTESKVRSVSAFADHMRLKNPFKSKGNRYPPGYYDQPGLSQRGLCGRGPEEAYMRREYENFRHGREPMAMMRQEPAPNPGYPQTAAGQYPYPQQIPPAAAPMQAGAYLAPAPEQLPDPSGVHISFETVVYILYGIGLVVGALLMSIFWKDVLKSVVILGVIAIFSFVLRFGKQILVHKHEQNLVIQGRLLPPPAPQQHYVIEQQQPYQHGGQQMGIPGGW